MFANINLLEYGKVQLGGVDFSSSPFRNLKLVISMLCGMVNALGQYQLIVKIDTFY